MALTDRFVSPIVNCQESQNAGSCIFVTRLLDCAEEPNTYTIEATAAVAANAEEISLQLLALTDSEGNAITPLPDSVLLREDLVLHFELTATPGTFVEVKLTEETSVTSAAAVAAAIEPAPAAIAANDVALTWALAEITEATDLPLNSDSQEDDRKVLKNGIQGSSVKTNVNLNVPLQYISDPSNIAQFNVILPASQSTEDIYAFVLKSGGLAAFGRAKVMNFNATGAINQIERVSANLNFQAPFALSYFSANPDINTATQIADLNTLARLSGVSSPV